MAAESSDLDAAIKSCGSDSSCKKTVREAYLKKMIGTTEDDKKKAQCDSAITDYRKSKTEFMNACSSGDMKACLEQANTCSVCKTNSGKEVAEYCPGYENSQAIIENRKDSVKKGNKEKRSSTDADAKKAIDINSCPDVNAKLVPGLNKKLTKFKETEKDNVSKIEKLQEDILKSNNNISEADSEFQNSSAELADKLAEQQKDFKNEFSDETKAKQALYDKMNQQLTEYSNAFEKLQQEHDNAISQLDVSCYNEALKQLQDEMAQRRAKLENSALSVNSVSNLFSTAKTSQEDINRNRGNTLYNSCQTRPDKIAEKNRIEGAYKTGIKMVNDGISTIRGQQVKLIGEISGQATQDKFKEKLQSMLNKNQNAVKKITDAHDLLVKKEQENIKLKTDQLNKLTAENNVAKSKIANLEAMGFMADETGDGSARDNPAAKFITGWDSTLTNAETAYNLCCSKTTNDTEAASAAKTYDNGACPDIVTTICSDPETISTSNAKSSCTDTATSRRELFLQTHKKDSDSGSTK